MSTATFIHAADLHLGRPFSSLRKSSPRLGEIFLRAGYQAWRLIVEAALERQVDFVTIGGDLFDRANPTVRALVEFKEGVERLNEADIPVFLALGNHDPLSEFPGSLSALPGLHIFGPDPEGITVEKCPGVKVYGASFKESAVTKNLAKRFKVESQTEIPIGLLHANVAGIPGHDNYAPCTLEDLKASGMAVWCLGHVHSHQVVSEDPLIIYPGTSQGAHIKETGPCGCYLVTVSQDRGAGAEFLPIAPVQWEQVDLDITDISSPEDIVSQAVSVCEGLMPDEDKLEALVVRITLSGRPDAGAFAALKEVNEIPDLISERLESQGIPIFVESLLDRTKSKIDLETLIEDQGFLGEFFKLVHQAEKDNKILKDLTDPTLKALLAMPNARRLEPDLNPGFVRDDRSRMIPLLDEAADLVAEMFVENADG
jgi:exonuclease SbcD